MKKYFAIIIFTLFISCKKEKEKYPIDQGIFFVETLPYTNDGNYKIFKYRIKHGQNKIFSKIELTVDGMDKDGKIIESGKAVERNMQQGEERIFYVKLNCLINHTRNHILNVATHLRNVLS